MAKLSLNELKTFVASYVASNNVSYGSYSATRDNVAGLLDKIGKIITLDTSYMDKLERFDGDFLEYGKDIEEWQEDLILPANYDSTGANALSPSDPSYRPPFYSKTLGRKILKTTIRNNNLERAVNNPDEFKRLVSMILKKLYDSDAIYKYEIKRQILADVIALCLAANTSATTFAANTAYNVGTYLTDGTNYGICVKAITVADGYATYSAAVAAGKIVTLNLYQVLAAPTDAATGEAFIKQVKTDVEIGSDVSEGHSLNGNTLGASDMILFVKQGVMPVIEVEVEAGAFNGNKVAIPTEIIVVPDFGNDANNVYAMLVDSRIMKLYPSYRALRDQENADGDFINYVLHTEYTAHASRNVFVKAYKSA